MSISGIGSSSHPVAGAASAGGSKPSGAAGAKSPEEDFLDYARMSPAERMRAAMLQEMGLTEDDLAKMSADERAKVNDEIARRIREKALEANEKRPGMIVDVAA